MKNTLLVPLVTSGKDVVFETNKDYMINCVDAITSFDLSIFDEIYFILKNDVASLYNIKDKISADMSRLQKHINLPPYNFVYLPQLTISPTETIYETLNIIGWDDRRLFIKDGDNKFDINDINITNINTINVITFSLEKLTLVDPQHKSYILKDKQNIIINCIEKNILSGEFIAGGYIFNDAKIFKLGYDNLKKMVNNFYISDVIYWILLNTTKIVIPIEANSFIDFNIKNSFKYV